MNELKHYGVLGMKWGVRRGRSKEQRIEAKRIRKEKLNAAYEDVKNSSTKLEKIFFRSRVMKQAAKYVVDNNMTIKQARIRATAEASALTATMLAAYGSIMLYKKAKHL